MGRISLTMSCGNYDRTRPFIEGAVQPEGIDLTVIPLLSPERHSRMMDNFEFDICELSMGVYISSQGMGKPITAIPVFPHRRFRHSFVFVNADSGVREPRDLIGKRVGIVSYTNTTGLWVRGALQHDYGVKPTDVTWVRSRPEEVPEWQSPSWLKKEYTAPGQKLADLLVRGDIQAQIFPDVVEEFRAGSAKVGRLFPNFKEVEMDYFRRTGLFPIMHTVVIRNDVLERYPWVANSLLKAWQRSKELCYEYIRDQRKSSLAWFGALWEEQREVMGPDPWPFGLKANRNALDAMLDYSVEQGILAKRPDVESLFFPSALEIPG